MDTTGRHARTARSEASALDAETAPRNDSALRFLEHPLDMFRSGAFVADHVEPVADSQVQPNGVDLTLESVLEQVAPGRLGVDGKRIGDREPVSLTDDAYALSPGGYVLQYAGTITIPEEHVGFLYPRSSLMRNSCMLNTAVWDAGYEGRGEGLLQVHHAVELEPGARVAQLVLARANHDSVYDGSYQGERVGSTER